MPSTERYMILILRLSLVTVFIQSIVNFFLPLGKIINY